jgi:hypothetical protein
MSYELENMSALYIPESHLYPRPHFLLICRFREEDFVYHPKGSLRGRHYNAESATHLTKHPLLWYYENFPSDRGGICFIWRRRVRVCESDRSPTVKQIGHVSSDDRPARFATDRLNVATLNRHANVGIFRKSERKVSTIFL